MVFGNGGIDDASSPTPCASLCSRSFSHCMLFAQYPSAIVACNNSIDKTYTNVEGLFACDLGDACLRTSYCVGHRTNATPTHSPCLQRNSERLTLLVVCTTPLRSNTNPNRTSQPRGHPQRPTTTLLQPLSTLARVHHRRCRFRSLISATVVPTLNDVDQEQAVSLAPVSRLSRATTHEPRSQNNKKTRYRLAQAIGIPVPSLTTPHAIAKPSQHQWFRPATLSDDSKAGRLKLGTQTSLLTDPIGPPPAPEKRAWPHCSSLPLKLPR